MIIWRIRTLSELLRRSHFKARHILPYLIVAMALVTLVFVFTDWSRPWDRDEFEAGIDSLTTVANGLLSCIGLYLCYRANGADDGANLAERLCTLGVVLFVRFLVIGALAFIAWAYVTVAFNLYQPSLEEFDLLSLLVVALFWLRLRSHVATVARPGAI